MCHCIFYTSGFNCILNTLFFYFVKLNFVHFSSFISFSLLLLCNFLTFSPSSTFHKSTNVPENEVCYLLNRFQTTFYLLFLFPDRLRKSIIFCLHRGGSWGGGGPLHTGGSSLFKCHGSGSFLYSNTVYTSVTHTPGLRASCPSVNH